MKTPGQLARVARVASREAIERAARANPAQLAAKLVDDPSLLNGYVDADVIVDVLFEAGQGPALERMKDSRSCNQRVRRLIVDKLLFA